PLRIRTVREAGHYPAVHEDRAADRATTDYTSWNQETHARQGTERESGLSASIPVRYFARFQEADVKDWLRLAVVLLSMPVAWFATGWLTRFTLSGPLPSGGFEGTPATILVQPIVLVA